MSLKRKQKPEVISLIRSNGWSIKKAKGLQWQTSFLSVIKTRNKNCQRPEVTPKSLAKKGLQRNLSIYLFPYGLDIAVLKMHLLLYQMHKIALSNILHKKWQNLLLCTGPDKDTVLKPIINWQMWILKAI